MKIHTVTNAIKENFDKETSEASERLKGKFTQSHVSVLNGSLVYTAVIFYED